MATDPTLWPGDVSKVWTLKEIQEVVYPRALVNMAAIRKALDRNDTLPVTFGSLIQDLEGCYTVPGYGWLVQSALMRTNLLPAAIPRADYTGFWRARYPTDKDNNNHCWYTGDMTIGFLATEFARRHNSLWWDSDMSTSTIKALARVVSGDIVGTYAGCNTATGKNPLGERDKPTPPWLVSALDALAGGEEWALTLNAERISGNDGVIEDAKTWLPDATWFGWNPSKHRQYKPTVVTDIRGFTTNNSYPLYEGDWWAARAPSQIRDFRGAANTAVRLLGDRIKAINFAKAQLEAAAAVKAQATADAKLGNSVPRIPPPRHLPSWQKAVVAAAIAGGGIAGFAWLKQRKARQPG